MQKYYGSYGEYVAAVRSLDNPERFDALERREADRARAVQMRLSRKAKHRVRDDEEFAFEEYPDKSWVNDPM